MQDPRSLKKRNGAKVTDNTAIFTGHYGALPTRPRASPKTRCRPCLFERADPVDRLFYALDRNDL